MPIGALPTFEPIVRAVAAVLVNGLWESALLVLAVATLLRFWSKINASTRYLAWLLTLVAVFIVPIVTTFALSPPIRIASLPVSHSKPSPVVPSTVTNVQAPVKSVPIPVQKVPATVLHHMAGQQEPSQPGNYQGTPQGESPAFSPMQFSIPLAPAFFIVVLWLLVTLLYIVRLAIGLIHLEKLKQNAMPLPVEYRDALVGWNAVWKGSREVRLCVSDETQVPIAVGLFDSMILIPRRLLDVLSQSEIDQVMLHEFAHLRRADDWTNCTQRILLALLSLNPAAYIISHQLDIEREVACDDDVLAATGAARTYAQCLTKMVEVTIWPYAPVPAPGVFVTRKGISLRIERLLLAGRNATTSLAAAPTIAAIVLLGTLALVMRMVAPTFANPIAPSYTSISHPAERTAALDSSTSNIELLDALNGAHTDAIASPFPIIAIVTAKHSSSVSSTPRALAKNVSIQRAALAQKVALHDALTQQTIAEHAALIQAIEQRSAMMYSIARRSAVAQSAIYRESFTVANKGSGTLDVPTTPAGFRVSCRQCNLRRVDWSGRDLHSAFFYDVQWNGAKLRKTNFSGSSLFATNFTGADLRGAIFRSAQIAKNCDFSSADITGADFSGASLTGCIFRGTQMSVLQAHEILASCKNCIFANINLRGLDLRGLTLSHTVLASVDLRHANLAGAQMYYVNLSGSRLEAANLQGATLNHVNFTGAKLNGINFRNATLTSCVLNGVDLTYVDLSRANLIGMDLLGRPVPTPTPTPTPDPDQ